MCFNYFMHRYLHIATRIKTHFFHLILTKNEHRIDLYRTVPETTQLGVPRTYVCPRCWFPGPKCMRYLRNLRGDESYALCPSRTAPRDIGNGVGRKRGRYAKNRNAQHRVRNIG